MDNHGEVRDFLTSRRARITPAMVGLTSPARRRRVEGLTRDEVALLSGVSVEYYAKLERGNLAGASDQVLDAIAATLRLDEAERSHLFDLARTAARSSRPRRTPTTPLVRETVQRLLDGMPTIPAYVRNRRLDVLAANPLGRALFCDLLHEPATNAADTRNLARYLFLDPRSKVFYREWDIVARDIVAAMRTQAGRNPYDRPFTNLVGELSSRSDEFRVWWAAHEVRLNHSGRKLLHHPVVGDLEFDGESLQLTTDNDLALIAYTYRPGSTTAEAITFLTHWVPQPNTSSTLATRDPIAALPTD